MEHTKPIFPSGPANPSEALSERGGTTARQVPLNEIEPEAEPVYSTGIVPSHELERLVKAGREIVSLEAIEPGQFQPASLDLRLGAVAYRVRASFLPGPDATVEQRLADLAMHKMDITEGGVLERGCVYIVPLMESLSLRHRMSAMGNPKSSTGRLDIFTRLITDYGTEFDRVREQDKGPLYAEVSPRTFSVLVRKGSRLSQIRIRRGSPPSTDQSMRRLQQEHEVVGSTISDDDIRNGVPVAVDVRGEATGGLIGYRAKSHTALIDIDRVDHYDPGEFWELGARAQTRRPHPRPGGVLHPRLTRSGEGAADARGGDDRL